MRELIPRRGVAAALLPLVLTGCIPKVDALGLRDVALDLPATFQGGGATASEITDAQRAELFRDPALVALIEEALAHNQELEIVRQEIHASYAELIARRGEPLPKVDLGVHAGVEKVGRFTSQGAADAATEIEPGRETPEHLGDFRVVFKASWEIDLWRRLRNATQAARTRALASVEGRNFVITGLVAEVATTWYELQALDRMIAVVDANLALLDEALDAVRAQQQAGRVSVLGVQRFEAERLKVESRRFDLLQRRVESENQLNLLCGRAPRPVAPSADGFLDRPLTDLDAGLPAQVLTRRPDVRQAELGLAAAKLDVKVARARFLPSLSIDADLGISAFNPAKFASMPASLLYNVAAGLLSPLFNRAEIKADWFASNARQMAAVARYEQTVLLAVVDVANHLAAIHNADAAFQTRSTQVARLAEAVETSNLLFRSARADYLEVLTTRREALEAELERVETRQQQLVARVDLYRALGGGWPGAAPPPTFTVGARAPRGAP